MKLFEQNPARLRNAGLTITTDDTPDAEGTAQIILTFSDGTILRANYWRLVLNGRARLSSFDHGKQYGLPAQVDAKEQVSALLDGRLCQDVQLDSQTADLTLIFSENTKLQIFNFAGYEIWDILFPDGTGDYSNFVL